MEKQDIEGGPAHTHTHTQDGFFVCSVKNKKKKKTCGENPPSEKETPNVLPVF
jgi:hypothetical protein